jgi:hypothetical protein
MKRGNANQPAGDEEQGATPEQKRAGQRADRKGMTRREMLGVLGALGASVGGTAWFMSGDKKEEGKEDASEGKEDPAVAESESEPSYDYDTTEGESTSADDLLSPKAKADQATIDAMEEKFEEAIENQRKAEIAEDVSLAEANSQREYDRKDASVNGFWEAGKESILPPTVVPALTKGLKAAIVYGKYRRQLAEAKEDIETLDGTGTATIAQVSDNKNDHVKNLEDFYEAILGGKKEITTSIVLAAILELWRFSSIIKSNEMVTKDKVSSGIGNVVGVGVLSALLYRGNKTGKTGDTSKSIQCGLILDRFEKQFDKASKDLEKEINARPTP